jgi:hypothetical protein
VEGYKSEMGKNLQFFSVYDMFGVVEIFADMEDRDCLLFERM